MYAPAWRCIPASRPAADSTITSILSSSLDTIHHLHIMYFLQSLPPLTFEAEAVFGCATFNSPMHDNREVVLAVGGMRTKPLLKF
jgi:hypothetical protein